MKEIYSNARILIVDDQTTNTNLLESFLKINGYVNFISTNDSRDVARLVQEEVPDLILLDIMMPNLSGIDILHWLKEESYLNGSMRVMVLTADITKETLKQALKAGAHDMLRKPFDFTELQLRINNLLHTNWLLKMLNDQSEYLSIEVDKRTSELKQKNDELEQFIYFASHDTQEPLRMITGFLQLIEKKYGDQIDEKGKEYIHFAIDGANRMKTLIKDMLDFSRAGNLQLDDLEFIDLNEILEDVKMGLKRMIESSGAIIEIEELPRVPGLSAPIRQIFQNLLANAITYHSEGKAPQVKISSEKGNDGETVVIVSDNGIGIPEEHQKKVFDVFTRLHSKEKYAGSGVGLSISKKLIERMGGTISLSSSPGEGSKFYLHFPQK